MEEVEDEVTGTDGFVATTASCAAGACCKTEVDAEGDGEEGDSDGEDAVTAAKPCACAVTLGLRRKYIAPPATNANTTTTAPANINTDELRLGPDAGCNRDG